MPESPAPGVTLNGYCIAHGSRERLWVYNPSGKLTLLGFSYWHQETPPIVPDADPRV